MQFLLIETARLSMSQDCVHFCAFICCVPIPRYPEPDKHAKGQLRETSDLNLYGKRRAGTAAKRLRVKVESHLLLNNAKFITKVLFSLFSVTCYCYIILSASSPKLVVILAAHCAFRHLITCSIFHGLLMAVLQHL